ncbi:MAG TPA: anti-sigma regulatory factor, partial [Nitrospirae bacterium]|nr:anti-sigma regulatory factor [Nitrospirota bacterium]
MGWGAGMGLPNIKKNADSFTIDTVLGEGTTLEIKFYLK